MVTKNILLSKKDAALLKEVIITSGRIVTFDELRKVFKKIYSTQKISSRISFLAKTGWLIRLKKGLYIIVTDIGALGTGDISLYTAAQALNKNSYISFENALQYHGMFDQMLSSIAAITYKRARKYQFKKAEVKFYHIKKALYFGFTREKSDIGLVNIAEKEKALLDILYYRSDVFHAGLVWGKLSEYRQNIDFAKLKQYALNFNLDIVRQIGFFLDRLSIDTATLYKRIHGKNSYSRMSATAKEFDAKWRLYYDSATFK